MRRGWDGMAQHAPRCVVLCGRDWFVVRIEIAYIEWKSSIQHQSQSTASLEAASYSIRQSALLQRDADNGRVNKGAWIEGALSPLSLALCKGNDFVRANVHSFCHATGKHPTRRAAVPHTFEV